MQQMYIKYIRGLFIYNFLDVLATRFFRPSLPPSFCLPCFIICSLKHPAQDITEKNLPLIQKDPGFLVPQLNLATPTDVNTVLNMRLYVIRDIQCIICL